MDRNGSRGVQRSRREAIGWHGSNRKVSCRKGGTGVAGVGSMGSVRSVASR
jgi:hypothetical protein